MNVQQAPWWKEAIALKDQLSVRELAEKFGVHPGALIRAFKDAGVSRRAHVGAPATTSGPSKTSDASTPGVVESVPAAQAASVSPAADSMERKLAPYVHRLGTTPDQEIARLAGVGVRAVADFRRARGIHGKVGRPPRSAVQRIPPSNAAGATPGPQTPAPAPVVHETGRDVELEVAEPIAVTEQPLAGAGARPARAAVLYAWRVRFEGSDGVRQRVVIGATVEAAVLAAERGGDLGALTGVERVAPLAELDR